TYPGAGMSTGVSRSTRAIRPSTIRIANRVSAGSTERSRGGRGGAGGPAGANGPCGANGRVGYGRVGSGGGDQGSDGGDQAAAPVSAGWLSDVESLAGSGRVAASGP